MKLGLRLFLAISLVAFCFADIAQGQGTDTLENKIRNSLTGYYKKYPQEKIFLHTDAGLYACGQTIWYKAYSIAYGKPSELSGIVYVQLLDSSGNVLIKNKLQLKNGLAHGNIDLPDSLHSGWYQLTGFTAWMMNFSQESFYHQKIYIQNLADAITDSKKSIDEKKYHIAFFTEGSDPIEGNLCNMAFKATDEDGLPVKVEGEVLAYDKKVIAKIITMHDGMGVFSIEGYAGKRNMAIVRFPDNTVQAVDLPAFKKSGITLQVDGLSPDTVEVNVAFKGSLQQYHNVILAAYQNNGIINTYSLQLTNGINVFNLQKKEFSTGILRLTLFSQDGMPQAERIVFVNKNDQVKLQLTADTLSLEPKGRSAFKLSSTDANGKPIKGNFSIAVTDADAVGDNDDNNIYSSILLSLELKGNIYRPGYYFTKNNDTLQQQLDLVMLTNGWRHFTWDSDLTAIKYPVERSQFIAGRILDHNEQLSAKDHLKIKLFIQNQDSSKYIGYVTPDSTGSFILNNYDHSGISDIFMETADAKNHIKKLKIKLFGTLNDSLQNVCYQPLKDVGDSSKKVSEHFISNALNERQVQLILTGVTLKTVNIHEKKLTPTEEIINDHISPLYQSDKAYTLDLVSNPTLDVGIINYIRGRFPGLQINGDGKDAQFYYRGAHTLGVTTGANPNNDYYPFFYINEAPTTIDDIIYLPMNEIALIRFIPTPVMFAPLNGGNVGALLIYTKNGNDDRRGLTGKEKFDHYTFNGYSITREFYSPDYSKPKAASSPDKRTTLYWNHDLVTGTNGEVKFHFYNSDNTKKYRVIIQGMDAEGRLGYLNEVF